MDVQWSVRGYNGLTPRSRFRWKIQEKINVGDWAVLPTHNVLELGPDKVQIESRAMEVLVYLAAHPGEVVSSDELIRVVWKGRVVGDGSVYRAINHLRQALGDDFQEPQFIQTVPKRGYRLVAPVRPGAATGTDRSIAVLPFVNVSPEAEQEYFSDGVTEEILNALAHVPGLRVVARTSAFSFKGKNVDIRSVGEKLNVEHVLEGSVRKSGSRLRITAQLIDVANGFHVWSESYDREMADVFEIQDEIAKSVVAKLMVELGLSPDEPLVKISGFNRPQPFRRWHNGPLYALSPGSVQRALFRRAALARRRTRCSCSRIAVAANTEIADLGLQDRRRPAVLEAV